MRKIISNFLFILFPALAFCETKIGIIGDSNSYWQFTAKEYLYYNVVQKNLQAQGFNISFPRVEASCISLGLAQEGLSRLKILLEHEPDIKILVITLGINDAFRGYTIPQVSKSLEDMIVYAQERNIKVLLGSIDIGWYSIFSDPYFKAYFVQIYSNLAQRYSVIVFPFIYYEFFLSKENQIGDEVHASIKGHQIWAQILENHIKKLLQ